MDAEAELDDLMCRYRGPLVGLLAAWGARWNEAIELAQDSFAEAWIGRARLRGALADDGVVGPWLRGIAWNLLRAARRRARQRSAPLPHAAEIAQESPEEEDPRAAALRVELDRLPPKERTALYMHYLEETSVREVAALLGVTTRTVEGRLYRGRRLLRERLLDLASWGAA